jgi:hypothetical protein
MDSKLPDGKEASRRAPKEGVATATSTRRSGCSPNSTPFSRQFMSSPMISCNRGAARGSAEDHRRRAHHPGDRPGLHRVAQRPPLPRPGELPAPAPVPLHAQTERLQQAATPPHPRDRADDQLPRLQLAGLLRRASPARLDTGPLRAISRDHQALGARRDRHLGLPWKPFPRLLGLPPLPALRLRRHPIAFELAPANAPEREVAREMLAGSARRSHRHQPTGRARRDLPAPRSKGRGPPLRLARSDPPVDRGGVLDLQGPSSVSSATAAGRCQGSARGSGFACSPSRRGSCTTPRSANRAAASAPTPVDWNQPSRPKRRRIERSMRPAGRPAPCWNYKEGTG